MKDFIQIVLEGDVVKFPGPGPSKEETPSFMKSLVTEKITIEILFSSNSTPGKRFDDWLHQNFDVEGSGSGPEGRDVWISVNPKTQEMVIAKIKGQAKIFGLPPIKWREIS